MTFSDPHVRRLLNKRFVNAWVNTQGDSNAGASFAHGPKEPAGGCLRGNGEHNIQLIVMTPKGKIFHVISGFISPKELRDQLSFALKNFGRDEEQLIAAHKGRIETIGEGPKSEHLKAFMDEILKKQKEKQEGK